MSDNKQNWNRVDDWIIDLAFVVEKHIALPFQYGVSDCGYLVADSVAAVMGEDILKPYRNYKTELGAAKILRKAGCADVGELFAKHFKECHKAHAMRGDIGAVLHEGEVCGGVFTGQGFACKSETGLIFAEYNQIIRAFEVR